MSPDPHDAGGAGAAGAERRRFTRLRSSCSARIRHVDGVDLPTEGVSTDTVDLSDGGLCLRSGEILPVGVFVAVELTLPGGDRPLVAMARVAYCEPAAGGGQDVGVEFVWVGWDEGGARRALAAHLHAALDGEPGSPGGPTA